MRVLMAAGMTGEDVSNEPTVSPMSYEPHVPTSPYVAATPHVMNVSSASTPNASSALTTSPFVPSSRGAYVTNDHSDMFDDDNLHLNSDSDRNVECAPDPSLVLRLRGGGGDDTPVRRTRSKVYPSRASSQPPSVQMSPRSAFIRGIKEAHTPANP